LPWLRAHAVHLALFAVGLVGYGAVAGDRLGKPSAAPHFVLQASAWARGELAIAHPRGDDWAVISTYQLDDGTLVRGRKLSTRPKFQVVGGGELDASRLRGNPVGKTTYMSFPPMPALLLLPQVLLRGERADDVLFTVVFAAAVLPLLFGTLRRLAASGLTTRTVSDDLWLVALFGFGSVFWFASVQGQVWFTAHVVGVFFLLCYAWCAIDARRPILAGLALAAATLTRTPMAFMFPLFLLELWRVGGGRASWRVMVKPALLFAAPVAAFAIAAAAYNLHRFGSPTEFGHSYLNVVQQQQIEQHGLFSYQYLARNLAVAFTLMPEVPADGPFVQVSGHGLAMWVTTPALVLLLWPKTRSPLHRALWITAACVAIPGLFYQNSGWIQFGYRFSLDYFPFLVLLLAVGGRRFGWGTRALIVAGIAVNLFGALTFGRHMEYYRATRNDYPTIVAH